MPADISLGDNYEIDENSSGNLVIKDSSGNAVLEHTDGGGWTVSTTTDVNDLVDATTGNIIYNTSTERLGDGNQSADLSDVVLTDILDANSANTVYDSSNETLGDGNQSVDAADVTTGDVTDTTSSNTVYDSSSETLGDGNQDVNANSVSTGNLATTQDDWSEETSNRSGDTWFQAPADDDILFVVGFISSSDGTRIAPTVDINETQDNNSIMDYGQVVDNNDRVVVGGWRVPAGYYYKVRLFGGTADYSIEKWSELR